MKENKKVIKGNFINIEVIEHSEQDIKDFAMENEMTTIITIPEMVFSLNHNKCDRVEAQESVRDKIKLYIANLADEISHI